MARRNGLLKRIGDFLLGEELPTLQEAHSKYGPDINDLPSECDSIPLPSIRYVGGGKSLKTVGDMKAHDRELKYKSWNM